MTFSFSSTGIDTAAGTSNGRFRLPRHNGTSGGGDMNAVKAMSFQNGGGTTQTATFNVTSDFGQGVAGGILMMSLHGWVADHAYGFIEWYNGGSSGNIENVFWRPFVSDNGVGVAVAVASGTGNLTVTLTSTHTNGHGWRWHIWSPS